MLPNLARALTLLLLVCAATACREETASQTPGDAAAAAPIDVRLTTAETGELARTIRSVGTFRAVEEMAVAAEVAGRVVAVRHDVGDRVGPGELLFAVDDTDHVLARDERRRALEASLARLGLTALPEGALDLERLPAVERARLAAENARARFERGEVLHGKIPPLISDQDLADLRTAWEIARSDHAVARLAAESQLAEARTRRAEVESAERRVADAHHVVPSGERPPLPGRTRTEPAGPGEYVVAERLVSAGDFVSVGDTLFRLVDVDPVELRVTVPERRMAGVAAGVPAHVELADGSRVAADVARVRPEVDPRTRTYQVDLLVPNADLRIPAGGFATAEIEVGRDTGVVLVEAASVRVFAGVRKVYRVEDGRAVECPVTLGRSISRDGRTLVEVTSGLAAGAEYVLDPPATLFGGAPVRRVGGAPGN